MSNMTDAFAKKELDGITGVAQLTTPATTYLALFTVDPTSTGDVAGEVTGGGYTRVPLSGAFSAATSTSVSNTAKISFPTATADWETVTHAGIMQTGIFGEDDMMMVIPLTAGITILATQTFEFDVGAMIIAAGCPDTFGGGNVGGGNVGNYE